MMGGGFKIPSLQLIHIIYIYIYIVTFTLHKTAGDSNEILLKFPLKCVLFNPENLYVTKVYLCL